MDINTLATKLQSFDIPKPDSIQNMLLRWYRDPYSVTVEIVGDAIHAEIRKDDDQEFIATRDYTFDKLENLSHFLSIVPTKTKKIGDFYICTEKGMQGKVRRLLFV